MNQIYSNLIGRIAIHLHRKAFKSSGVDYLTEFIIEFVDCFAVFSCASQGGLHIELSSDYAFDPILIPEGLIYIDSLDGPVFSSPDGGVIIGIEDTYFDAENVGVKLNWANGVSISIENRGDDLVLAIVPSS